ncbi:hypothetical protein D3C78_1256710 [compost metagenome]
MPAEALVQLANGRGTVDHQAPVGLRMNVRIVQALLAFELADDFFENVFQGDDAQHFAVFVDHHAQASLLLVKVEQLQLQRGTFRHEVRLVAGRQQRFPGQARIGQQVKDVSGVEDGFDLVDITVEHRQARALVVAQLFDDFLDGVIEIDAVHVAARYQDVIDGDVVQRVDAWQRVRAACGFRGRMPLRQRFVLTLLHHFGLAGEWPCQQLADAIEQPCRGIDDFQR